MDKLKFELALNTNVRFERVTEEHGPKRVVPPDVIVRTLLADPASPLPILTRIVGAPVVTSRDIEHARALVVEELLGDFPFSGQADRAHAHSVTASRS